MATLSITLPDEVFAELNNIAAQLKQTPEQCLQLSLSHFLQTDSLENAIEGIARMADKEPLVDFPELKEELGIDIQFHPIAMDELESLDEEDQVEVLGQLIERISAEEEELDNTLDLVLKEEGDNQVVLSGFNFGDVVYQVGTTITIYHIALSEEEEEMEEEEDDEEEEENAEEKNEATSAKDIN